MSITETKIEGLQSGELKVAVDAPRKVPQHLPKLHFLSLICGMRGAGKTTTLCELVKKYDTNDRLIPNYKVLTQHSF